MFWLLELLFGLLLLLGNEWFLCIIFPVGLELSHSFLVLLVLSFGLPLVFGTTDTFLLAGCLLCGEPLQTSPLFGSFAAHDLKNEWSRCHACARAAFRPDTR